MTENLSNSLSLMLQKDIFNGVYPIGSKIPSERGLSDTYGVSRITVRDAIRKLTQLGLLKKIPKSGTYVNDYKKEASISLLMGIMQSTRHIDIDIFQSLLEIRKIGEVYLTGKSVLRFGDMEIKTLTELIQTMESSMDNPLVLSESDVRIHELFIVNSGNLIAKLIFNSIRQLYTYYVDYFYTLEGTAQESLRLYKKLLDASIRRDSDYASYIMEKVLIYAESRVRDVLHPSGEGKSVDISKITDRIRE